MLTPEAGLPHIRFSINTHGRNKDWDYELLASKYEDKTGTLQDVVDHIKQGHAVCAGLLGGQRRAKANVIGSQWVLLDIDNSKTKLDENGNPVKDADGRTIKVYDPQLTIEQAVAHPFIQQYCALIYTSASHKSDWHKLRLVFLLPQFESDVGIIEAMIRLLMEHLPHDPNCKDASRVFYGNTNAEIPLFNPEAFLPIEWREQASAAAADELARKEQQRKQQEIKQAEYQRQLESGELNREDTDALILDALRFIPPREPGTGNYEECLMVLMALYDHFGEAEAERVAEGWSPSIQGTTWNISRKLRSFRRGGVTIGSLFHIAKQHGWRFPERERTRRDDLNNLKLHPDTISEIKQRIDIVDVIGQHISLTKRGKNFLGCCPFHDDKNFSFSVSLDKQSYQCFCCGRSGSAIQFLMELNKHSFTDVVLNLAQCYQVPVRSLDGTAISAETLRDRTISQDEWEVKFGLPNWFKGQLNRLSKIFKGFGSKPLLPKASATNPEHPLPKPQPKIYYTPGKLPTRENYNKIGCPKIQFAPGERLQLIAELVGLGYHDILDSSATGTSKSHDAGLAEPERFGVDRLWYFAQDHRNPTTHTVEANYTDMPVRTGGMVEDFTRRTALNKPHIRWPQRDETPTTQGNCFRSPLFHILAEKGYQDAETEAKINPICGSCHMKDSCAAKGEAMPMPGASFRNDRREAITFSDRLRASINSSLAPKDLLPKTKTSEEGEELVSNRNAAFIDEAMRQLAPTAIVEAHLADFDQMFAEIESKLPDVHAALKPLRLALRPILAGEIPPTRETYHGWNDAALRGVLREFRELLFDKESESDILPEIIAQLKSLQPDLAEILQEPDSFSKAGVEAKDRKGVSKDTSKFIRARVRQNSYREMADNLKSLASNWLIPFLEVWCGSQRGALRIDYGVLKVTTRSTRYAEVCKAMQWVVYLDATADRQYLALYLDINPSEIVHIEQEPARVENLTIVQVTGFGLAGHERSDSFNQRIDAFLRGVGERHSESNISGLDHKEHAAPRGWGWWHNDNRGSNKYMLSLVLVSFGTPYQNIGSLQDLWLTLTGDRNVSKDAPGFSEFVKWQTQSEIAQAAGRLRANLRPNEKLTYYYCSDFDLTFLEEYYPGATIKQESAFSIAPQAGTETEQSHWRIQQSILDYAKQTGTALEKLTQVTAARVSGVSQGRVSQVAAHFGGWGAFKKLLALLLETPYRITNNFEPLDEDQQFVVNTYLPEVAEGDPPDAIEVMVTLAQVYGWRIFQAILAATSSETRGRLLAALIGGLPPALMEEFRAIASVDVATVTAT